MYKLKKPHLKELIICLVVCMLPLLLGHTHVQHFVYTESLFPQYNENVLASRTMHNGVQVINIKDMLEETAGGKYYMTHYELPNGDTVVSGSLRGKTEDAVVLQSLHIIGEADITLLSNGEYESKPLSDGDYNASLFLINSDGFDIACYTPKQFKFLENEALEHLVDLDGYLKATKTDDGFDIEIISNAVDENCCCDFMLTYSAQDLVQWNAPNVNDVWKYYTVDDDKRWTYTGYYRISPDTYYPTGENVYYRCQACYLGSSFINANPRERLMDDMLCCIIDTMAKQQNEAGFFPSTSLSLWLKEDYNIGTPYYDTRFNSDLIEIFIKAYNVYGNNTAYFALQKYCSFFTNYVKQYGIDDGNGGILVPDYWHPDADMNKTHTSLNHFVSEINVLYKLSDLFNREDLSILADKMLAAIENTGMDWVRPNSDLWYCIYPNGNYGRDDYPALTYNDLYDLQDILKERYGSRSHIIDTMMAEKLNWMLNNNIDSYKK